MNNLTFAGKFCFILLGELKNEKPESANQKKCNQINRTEECVSASPWMLLWSSFQQTTFHGVHAAHSWLKLYCQNADRHGQYYSCFQKIRQMRFRSILSGLYMLQYMETKTHSGSSWIYKYSIYIKERVWYCGERRWSSRLKSCEYPRTSYLGNWCYRINVVHRTTHGS